MHHFVHEPARAIDLRDARRESLAQPEVPAFECQQIAELQAAGCPTWFDDALAGERGAFVMNIDVEGEIEAQLNRRVDRRLDDDVQVLSARRLIARSHERRMMSLPGWITRQ